MISVQIWWKIVMFVYWEKQMQVFWTFLISVWNVRVDIIQKEYLENVLLVQKNQIVNNVINSKSWLKIIGKLMLEHFIENL